MEEMPIEEKDLKIVQNLGKADERCIEAGDANVTFDNCETSRCYEDIKEPTTMIRNKVTFDLKPRPASFTTSTPIKAYDDLLISSQNNDSGIVVDDQRNSSSFESSTLDYETIVKTRFEVDTPTLMSEFESTWHEFSAEVVCSSSDEDDHDDKHDNSREQDMSLKQEDMSFQHDDMSLTQEDMCFQHGGMSSKHEDMTSQLDEDIDEDITSHYADDEEDTGGADIDERTWSLKLSLDDLSSISSSVESLQLLIEREEIKDVEIAIQVLKEKFSLKNVKRKRKYVFKDNSVSVPDVVHTPDDTFWWWSSNKIPSLGIGKSRELKLTNIQIQERAEEIEQLLKSVLNERSDTTENKKRKGRTVAFSMADDDLDDDVTEEEAAIRLSIISDMSFGGYSQPIVCTTKSTLSEVTVVDSATLQNSCDLDTSVQPLLSIPTGQTPSAATLNRRYAPISDPASKKSRNVFSRALRSMRKNITSCGGGGGRQRS